MTDHWEHRAAGLRCKSCMWWLMKQGHETAEGPRIGRCRKHAPTLNGWPATFDGDWCGDHKIDEAKL